MSTSAPDERRQAVDLFNEVWALLENGARTPEQDERMVHAAHASRMHWEAVGTTENVAVGDWLCSRVYAVLGRGEAAMFHGRWCLRRAEAAGLPAWVSAEGHEAIARAHAVLGELGEARRHAEEARTICESIDDADDRAVVLADLATLRLA